MAGLSGSELSLETASIFTRCHYGSRSIQGCRKRRKGRACPLAVPTCVNQTPNPLNRPRGPSLVLPSGTARPSRVARLSRGDALINWLFSAHLKPRQILIADAPAQFTTDEL